MSDVGRLHKHALRFNSDEAEIHSFVRLVLGAKLISGESIKRAGQDYRESYRRLVAAARRRFTSATETPQMAATTQGQGHSISRREKGLADRRRLDTWRAQCDAGDCPKAGGRIGCHKERVRTIIQARLGR